MNSLFFGQKVSKEKTIEYRFFKAKSTECEQRASSLARQHYATHEWTGQDSKER